MFLYLINTNISVYSTNKVLNKLFFYKTVFLKIKKNVTKNSKNYYFKNYFINYFIIFYYNRVSHNNKILINFYHNYNLFKVYYNFFIYKCFLYNYNNYNYYNYYTISNLNKYYFQLNSVILNFLENDFFFFYKNFSNQLNFNKNYLFKRFFSKKVKTKFKFKKKRNFFFKFKFKNLNSFFFKKLKEEDNSDNFNLNNFFDLNNFMFFTFNKKLKKIRSVVFYKNFKKSNFCSLNNNKLINPHYNLDKFKKINLKILTTHLININIVFYKFFFKKLNLIDYNNSIINWKYLMLKRKNSKKINFIFNFKKKLSVHSEYFFKINIAQYFNILKIRKNMNIFTNIIIIKKKTIFRKNLNLIKHLNLYKLVYFKLFKLDNINNIYYSNKNLFFLLNQFKFVQKKNTSNLFIINFFKKYDFNSINKNLFYYNNHFPLYLLNNNIIYKFYSNFSKNNKPLFYKNMFLYLTNFFEFFFKKNIYIKINTNNTIKTNQKEFDYIYNKYKNYKFNLKLDFNLLEFLEILWYSFYSKDIFLLRTWFVKNFEIVDTKHQKLFLNIFQTIIYDNFEFYSRIFKLKGFYFDIKGKISASSNAKKKHSMFKIGKINKNNKFTKINFQQASINSLGGSIGVTIIISY